MTTCGSRAGRQQLEQEALMMLAEYLELPLRKGGSLIMMQQCDDVCGMYVGNVAAGQADLAFCGTVAGTIADGILRLTKVGRNRVEIAGRQYYFIRSFTHFEDRGAVVLAPA
ncbi:conserved hypothetical protein [Paraburkholderia piptadeniae]|uniref:Uncharacterized protein n=1 Tax=Paraburkholderia piptadeniae TaxID=1701573 RepID=A0A1N7RTW6_9BURK|nr:hypothetical protein [Paraburkholderia piptadeniae]SIT38152.1 conserved hypothetical protein [Paraburkholderia piptadeniae]